MSDFLDVTFPPSRLVQGNPYELNDKDWQGKPLTIKTGPNAGQPTKRSFVACAVKKTPGVTHWANEPWGAPIWAFGHNSFPKGEAQAATFAWKIEDGDSQAPNKKGRKNCDTEGMPGHWIINISSSFLPKIVTAAGDPLDMPGAVKTGYWVVPMVRIQSNGQTGGNAGIYINPVALAYVGIDKEISSGPNVKGLLAAAGQFQLPAHVQAAPVGAPAYSGAPVSIGVATPPPPAGTPTLPPGSPPPPPAMGVAAPSVPATPPTAPAVTVAPSPTFLAPPPPGAAPAAPAAPAVPSGPTMTALAKGLTYAQFIAQGWNDAQLRANGYMV
jgi:hypothetical protein